MKKSKIPFKVISRKAPGSKKGKDSHYGILYNRYRIGLDELLADITKGSSINPIEAHAVIQRLLSEVSFHLQQGRIVSLGDLGSFYMTIKSESTEKPEDFTAKNIKRKVFRFRAGSELRKSLDNVQFEKVEDDSEGSAAQAS